LKEPYDPNVHLSEVDDEELRQLALTDLKDLGRSEAMVFFSEPQNQQPPRGGRHVEFGMAVAWGLQLFVIGERENLFHHLGRVKLYPTWKGFMLGECFG
jgi:hypothetical protein